MHVKPRFNLPRSDWVTGKRGRRNSVGSLDSTIEVSWAGHDFPACRLSHTLLMHVCLIHNLCL